MNREHLEGLRSDAWASFLESDLLPWVLDDSVDLGQNVVEVGPGPGRTTDLLQLRFDRLTAVEIDEDLASELGARFKGSSVTVQQADGAEMPFEDSGFSGACCFIMLHHVPTAEHQDRLFREVGRVLSPGAVFVGADAIGTEDLISRHVDDTCNPIDPATLAERLKQAGFTNVEVTERTGLFKFRAHVPA